MIAETFIQNILIGVRRWVNGKLEALEYVVSSHLNEIEAKLDGIESGAQVNVIETVKVNGTTLTPTGKAVDITVPAAAVSGVKSGDKILALDGTLLTSTLSLNYDSTNTKLQIKGISGEVISEIDATAFIKDGLLDYAALHTRATVSSTTTWSPSLPAGVTEPSGATDGTYIVLVWNTDAGKSATFINVTSLIDTYTAGTGLTLNGHQFSLAAAGASTIGGVKVAAAATSGLTLGNDGALSIAVPTVADVIAILEDDSQDPTT
jgi:hypothetical protein